MNKSDARLLNPSTQNYLRQQAIRLREQGKRFVDIATYLGVHRNTVSDWWGQYQQYGSVAQEQQKRGNKLGQGRTLSQCEETRIQQQMRSHFPEELGIDSALWTRGAVQSQILQGSGVKMPIRTLWGVSQTMGIYPSKTAQACL